jgi:hypothetical protein
VGIAFSQSVVIAYFDVAGVPCSPLEADAPLLIDPNAPLAGTTPGQFLQLITDGGRRSYL